MGREEEFIHSGDTIIFKLIQNKAEEMEEAADEDTVTASELGVILLSGRKWKRQQMKTLWW